jgi:formate dehydrogenase subunit gamma
MGDGAVVRARHAEDVVVGDEVIRHRLLSRVIHWCVAVSMFLCLFTGLPIWTPIFGWMAYLFGGLAVCRWLHPWMGIVFAVASLAMFVHWVGEMHLNKDDWAWIGPRLFLYMKAETDDSQVGKYNGGQKIFFFTSALAALALLLSGVVLWFPMSFGQGLREASWVLHDVTFILFTASIVGHIYLGTASEPGTFVAMTRGAVSKKWARFHHPRWYRETTGEDPKRS